MRMQKVPLAQQPRRPRIVERALEPDGAKLILKVAKVVKLRLQRALREQSRNGVVEVWRARSDLRRVSSYDGYGEQVW